MIEGFVRLMNSADGLTGPVNLGNPGEYTMLELAETILKLSKSSSKLVNKPLPQDDPRQRQPDIALAQNALGWVPHVKLEDGLKETIDYFRRIL